LYVDTTNNNGDPDTADRYFRISRDGSTQIWAGIGSNSDSQLWNDNYSSDNWTAVVGSPSSSQWVVEMTIDASAEMGALSPDAFGMMVQVLFTGSLDIWPEDANSDLAGTWQDINNIACSNP
jgi:hypothetical protein